MASCGRPPRDLGLRRLSAERLSCRRRAARRPSTDRDTRTRPEFTAGPAGGAGTELAAAAPTPAAPRQLRAP